MLSVEIGQYWRVRNPKIKGVPRNPDAIFIQTIYKDIRDVSGLASNGKYISWNSVPIADLMIYYEMVQPPEWAEIQLKVIKFADKQYIQVYEGPQEKYTYLREIVPC